MTVDEKINTIDKYVKAEKLRSINNVKIKESCEKLLQDLYQKIANMCLVANKLADSKLFPKEFLIDYREYGKFGFDDSDIVEDKGTYSGLWLNEDSNTRFNLWDNYEYEKVILGKVNIDSGETLIITTLDYLTIINAFYNFEKEFYNWFDKKFGVVSDEDKYKEQKSDLYERIEGIQSQIDDIDIEFSESIPDNIGDTPTDVGNMVSSVSVLQTEISDWLDKHKNWV